MKCLIYTADGLTLLRTVERKPVCEVDFCDTCGDCLSCYGEDPCTGNKNGEHMWVQYGEPMSRTALGKIIKAELAKTVGKTIKSVTWRNSDMTIHFTDGTHLFLANAGDSVQASLRGQPTTRKGG